MPTTVLQACLASRSALSSELAPYHSGGWGRCTGRISIGTSLKVKYLPCVVEPLLRQALQDHLERLGEALRPGGRIDAVIAHLVGRDAAADAELEPSAAHLVEHADLVDQAQRMIEVARCRPAARSAASWCAAPRRPGTRWARAPCRAASHDARPDDRRGSPRARRARSAAAARRTAGRDRDRRGPCGRRCRTSCVSPVCADATRSS